MALHIYDFANYDGLAHQHYEKEDCEIRVYLKGHANVELALVTKYEDRYHLYNFVLDKEHLRKMRKEDISWFASIEKFTFYITEMSEFLREFVNWALKNGVSVELIHKPF